ncbi:outer membrane protein [Pseudovibrio ascidiaceicola]|uniref:outer membrane protein n=1 Tax=Pseudovibrio ascidiaceicola TaxID=285279 RepID=UPI003D36BE47
MKNKHLISLASAAAMSLAALASAQAEEATSWYIQGTGGLSLGSLTVEDRAGDEGSLNDEGFNSRIGVGAYIFHDFRVGVESGYASFSENSVDVDTWDVLAVAYYDFKNDTRLTPFVGLGAGLAQQRIKIGNGANAEKETTNHLALKVGAGVGYEIADNLELLAEHSFQYHVKAELDNETDVSAYQNQFNVGLRYSF